MLDRQTMPTMFSELAARALRQARERDRKAGPRVAEILPCEPLWHVVVTEPGREGTAAAHLAGRRFGVYLPELAKRENRRGRAVIRNERIFPGYVFVRVYDIEAHWSRIEGCAGVRKVLLDSQGNPVVISDADMRVIEGHEAMSLSRLCQRTRKRAVVNPDIAEGEVRMSTKSYFHNVNSLDKSERITLLHKALGLGASVETLRCSPAGTPKSGVRAARIAS